MPQVGHSSDQTGLLAGGQRSHDKTDLMDSPRVGHLHSPRDGHGGELGGNVGHLWQMTEGSGCLRETLWALVLEYLTQT